jgi:metal-dependent HD superfamily phosphatase/phosphodiesterase
MTAPIWGVCLPNWVCFPGRIEAMDAEWIQMRAAWDRWKKHNGDLLTAKSVNEVTITDGDDAPMRFEIIYNPPDGRYRVTCNKRVVAQGESVPI